MRDVLFPVASVAVLVLTAAGIVWRARNKRWFHDAQLAFNAQPRLSLILPVFLVLGAGVTVILGVGSLEAEFALGWGYFVLALDALLIVGFTVWIARRPFPMD
ncbi:hypothetical protein DEI96_000550 [Curtobacterium sp. MCLR17_031]|uniref:hypothetical protein n=1 Tax=Curtobacterium sp. MCLR17_031 TaxID=2175622 RepID=UPI000DA872D7|nr:hypothetical protein [Curtobacterium sp. MCLR17_031]WIE58134.1 hypothetical protein DEI96_000550 [Curtobacterium sp. MCLR17_031]